MKGRSAGAMQLKVALPSLRASFLVGASRLERFAADRLTANMLMFAVAVLHHRASLSATKPQIASHRRVQ
jgi:hypothetical protein